MHIFTYVGEKKKNHKRTGLLGGSEFQKNRGKMEETGKLARRSSQRDGRKTKGIVSPKLMPF